MQTSVRELALSKILSRLSVCEGLVYKIYILGVNNLFRAKFDSMFLRIKKNPCRAFLSFCLSQVSETSFILNFIKP